MSHTARELSLDQRLARHGRPLRILIASEPCAERAKLIDDELARPQHVTIVLAETATDALAKAGQAEVVIVSDQLRPAIGARPQPTWGANSLLAHLRSRGAFCVGWPAFAAKQPRSQHYADVTATMRELCHAMLVDDPRRPERVALGVLLDVVGTPHLVDA